MSEALDTVMRRVRKLLKLGRSDNPNEAAACRSRIRSSPNRKTNRRQRWTRPNWLGSRQRRKCNESEVGR